MFACMFSSLCNVFLHLSAACFAWEGSRGSEAPALQGFLLLQKWRKATISLEEASHGHPGDTRLGIGGEKKRNVTSGR